MPSEKTSKNISVGDMQLFHISFLLVWTLPSSDPGGRHKVVPLKQKQIYMEHHTFKAYRGVGVDYPICYISFLLDKDCHVSTKDGSVKGIILHLAPLVLLKFKPSGQFLYFPGAWKKV